VHQKAPPGWGEYVGSAASDALESIERIGAAAAVVRLEDEGRPQA